LFGAGPPSGCASKTTSRTASAGGSASTKKGGKRHHKPQKRDACTDVLAAKAIELTAKAIPSIQKVTNLAAPHLSRREIALRVAQLEPGP